MARVLVVYATTDGHTRKIVAALVKRIVAKAGGDSDPTRDYEYTDWDDLRTFARQFAGRVEAGRTRPCAFRARKECRRHHLRARSAAGGAASPDT